MNRENKFRFWNIEQQKWDYKKRLMIDGEGVIWLDDEDGAVCVDSYYIPCQYTGKKDKNDKMIFEGDICKFSGMRIDKLNGIGLVYWSDCGFSVRTLLPFALHQAYDIEIIGNNFEHPHLLKANNESSKYS